ncbi:MAG: hypothetical protein ACK5OA_15795, partial [Acidovorax sp.]
MTPHIPRPSALPNCITAPAWGVPGLGVVTRPAVATLAAALLLCACTSTPLPPWPSGPGAVTPPKSSPPAPLPSVQRATVVPAPLGMPNAGAVARPLAPRPNMVVQDEAPIAAAPYNAAVAARFPEPPITYDTPGLGRDRRAFTTNAELGQWLRSLAEAAPAGATRTELVNAGTSQRGEPILRQSDEE